MYQIVTGVDNLSTLQSEPVRDCLAHHRHARSHLNFTPVSAIWPIS